RKPRLRASPRSAATPSSTIFPKSLASRVFPRPRAASCLTRSINFATSNSIPARPGPRSPRSCAVSTSEALADDTMALASALALVDRAGQGRVRAISRLVGGRNNQVYRIETDTGMLALKRYFSDPRDGRNRLAAEWNFLQRAWREGIRVVPQPLACAADERTALYSFVPGRKLAASEIAAAHVDAAADFIIAINAPSRSGLDPASDA